MRFPRTWNNIRHRLGLPMRHNNTNIHIIGGGIAGLTAALALRKYGFAVTLFEQSGQFGEVGAGITIGPNASRVLLALGLGEKLAPYTWTPRHAGVLHFKTGEQISYALRGENYVSEFGAPFWHIHRADLLQVLVDVLSQDPGVEFRLGHKLTGISQTDEKVNCEFANGGAVSCDVLIASDGIKSLTREIVFPGTPATFTGYVAWRGLVDLSNLPGLQIDPDFALYAGPGRIVGRYALRRRGLMNYVAIATRKDWREEGWTVRSEVAEVASEFQDWCEDVQTIIRATPPERCFKWALHVREPLDNWVDGRVALLGDAAHPMTPFLGLGAGIGIEDAIVLARAFSCSDDWQTALARYQKARIGHAANAQQASARQGLHLLNAKPQPGKGKTLYNDDMLGLYSYDATSVAV